MEALITVFITLGIFCLLLFFHVKMIVRIIKEVESNMNEPIDVITQSPVDEKGFSEILVNGNPPEKKFLSSLKNKLLR